MILSEYDRRWVEVRFYQFISETYELRHKSIDILTYADAICEIGSLDKQKIKQIIRTMISDTYYQSTKRELILLAHIKGLTTVQIANYIGITRQGVSKFIKSNLDNYTPLPRCGIDEDCEIIKFLQTLDSLQNIGRFGNGTTDESSI